MRFHHVGIATPDATETAEIFAGLFEAPVCHTEEFDGLDISFIELPNSYLELLEPTEDGTVSRYLERDGPGIHHVAFEVADLEDALAHATAQNVELIDTSPRPGAWGHEVAFLHPDSTGGVLVEFVEC